MLLIAGVVGFHLGATRFFDWQAPVETAQVLAGLVRYPEETPFFIYHVRLWTLLHQVCAALFAAGASEIWLSRAMSGLLGMVSLQALAMVTFAFSRRTWLAIGVSILLFVSHVTDVGAVYPIFLMGVPFTYGIIGLSLITLTAAVLGSGMPRTGAFLLGLAPAIHPSLGFWLWLILLPCVAVERDLRTMLRGAARWLAAGCVITIASLALHQWSALGVPSVPTDNTRRYFDAFVTLWDGHRRAVDAGETAVLFNVAALLISTLWLWSRRLDLAPPAAVLLRFVQVSATLALLLVPVTWIDPHKVPTTILMLMPGRILNVDALTIVAVIVGLLAALPGPWTRLALLGVTGALIANRESVVWRLFVEHPPSWIEILSPRWIVLAAAVAALAAAASRGWPASPPGPGLQSSWLTRLANAGIAVVLLVALVAAYRVPENRTHLYLDRTNSGVLAAASRGEGLLLTAGNMPFVQMRTRRPLLIDSSALDTAGYMPATAAAMHAILLDIYGIDLFNPPADARGEGRVPQAAHRKAWEQRTREEWRTIARTYRVTQVLTPATWQLDLPVVAGDRRLLLYALPW